MVMPIATRVRHDLSLAAPWLRWVGRCGFVAGGLVYVLIGSFALTAAFEPGKRPDGSKGALAKLASAPFGHAMLLLLAAGLAAFVLWQAVQGIFDPEHRAERWTFKRVARRLGHLSNAALHAVLVGDAMWRLSASGGTADNGRAQAHWTALAMQLPPGRWAVAGLGAGIAVFGIVQLCLAIRPNKNPRVDLTQTRLRGVIITLGVLGYAARGVVFGLIGAFLIHAAWRYDAAKATGIAGALSALKERRYGPWLLGAVAVGLIAYGLFQIAIARYRKFRAG
jgi:hypothetical protein